LEEGIKFESTDGPTGCAGSSATKTENKIQNELLNQLKETTKIAAALFDISKDVAQHRAGSNRRSEESNRRSEEGNHRSVEGNRRSEEGNRRSNFSFYIDLPQKKHDLLSLHIDANSGIISKIARELLC
jgi:hypothetical protein